MPTRQTKTRAPRLKQLNVRIEPALYEAAMARAAEYGLGPAVRALLRAYVRGDIDLLPDDVLMELASAPRGRRRKPRKRNLREGS